MPRNASNAVRITRGPASEYEAPGETIVEFTDGQSGGLIAFKRDKAGALIVDLYRMDADVLVRLPRNGTHAYTSTTKED